MAGVVMKNTHYIPQAKDLWVLRHSIIKCKEMKREELIAYDKWLTRRKWGTGEIISPEKAADLYLAEQPLPPAEGAEQEKILTDFAEKMNTAMVNNDPEFEQIVNDHYFDLIEQPTAEGAEEIIDSIVESLGDPINIHNHAFEIRPYTVEHKTEWWIFHKEVSSGEPLAQWLSKFATLHAQKIADKMVSEKLREELIKYEIHWNFVLRDNAEKVVDEYLKSRESHDNIR